MEEKYYSIDEVAELLKVAYLTVYRWIKAGKLEAVKAGKQYRITQVALDVFLTSDHNVKSKG
ncbi:helix-turn-helix domain-containing protein [Candidatus Nomurabacteria bacterium]|nr:helix-turn-helix domain-containing protein [Candidatus Nomurabacteria bacterium]